MADETTEVSEETQAPAPKKSPVLLIVLLVNTLLAVGAVGYVLTRPSDADAAKGGAAAAPAAVADPTAGSKSIDPEKFFVKEMMPFIVNLYEEDGNRYLKVTVSLRLGNEEALGRFDKVVPAIRDAYIQHLTSLGLADIATGDKKLELKKELTKRANEIMLRGDVVDVYFKDFVVQ